VILENLNGQAKPQTGKHLLLFRKQFKELEKKPSDHSKRLKKNNIEILTKLSQKSQEKEAIPKKMLNKLLMILEKNLMSCPLEKLSA
jgi:hypothetical protein